MARLVLIFGLFAWILTGSGGAAGWMRLGAESAEGLRYAAAVRSYRAAAAWAVRDPRPWLAMGRIYLQQGRHSLAHDAFWRALELDWESPKSLAALGDLASAQGLSDQAAEWYARAWANAPEKADLVRALGVSLGEAGRMGEAVEALTRCVEMAPDDWVARLELALLLAASDLDAATGQARVAMVAPDARVASRAAELAKALLTANAADDEGERNALVGLELMRQERWSLALVPLQRAVDLLPDNSEVRAYVAYALMQQGHLAEALPLLERVVEMDPPNPQGYHFLAMVHLRLGWPREAVDALAMAAELDPDSPAIAADIAQAYTDLGAYDYAEEWFEEAIEDSGGLSSYLLAQAAFHIRHVYNVQERGLPAARLAIEIEPENAAAHDLLGWGLYLAGDEAGALDSVRRAIELDPALASAHLHLAEIWRAAGAEDAARESYLRAIDLDSVGVIRERATERLRE
jgi:tetratricopeptide (TPR) repeat protein